MRKLLTTSTTTVTSVYTPLSGRMQINSSAPLAQMYYSARNEWMPDHRAKPIVFGYDYDIIDPDGIVGNSSFSPDAKWYVNGEYISTSDAQADYYLNTSGNLICRKNVTHDNGDEVSVEVQFTDPRTGQSFILTDTVQLTAQLQNDEQWMLTVVSERLMKYVPMRDTDPVKSITAKATYGCVDKSDDVEWVWEYKEADADDWAAIDNHPAYVSGQGTKTLKVDADCTENMTLRCRIKVNGATLNNEAGAAIAWLYLDVNIEPYSKGGNLLLAHQDALDFDTHVHVAGRSDLTDEEKEEWLLVQWNRHLQGGSSNTVIGAGNKISVQASTLRNNVGSTPQTHTIAPRATLRGCFAILQTSTGDNIQTSAGDNILVRS